MKLHPLTRMLVTTPLLEKNNSDVDAIIEELVVSKQAKIAVEEPETVDE